MSFEPIRTWVQALKENVNKVIVGKEDVIEQFIIALLASGHVLLEDVPGTGKTMLAKTLAKSLDCQFKRVQFTPDLLPSDLSGIHYFNQKKSDFEFRPGPIFTHILLADEINRATPRTQSSLLECMEERQVSIDGETKTLERPFFVIATQNPIENQGTFPLPEAQLDRFIMKINMGYPKKEEGIAILKRFKEEEPLEKIESVVTRDEVIHAQDQCRFVTVDDSIYEYIMQIVEETRTHEEIRMGVSPRGAQALLKTVQIRAVIQGRDYVMPDDVKALTVPVFAHRLVLQDTFDDAGHRSRQLLEEILSRLSVPTEPQLEVR